MHGPGGVAEEALDLADDVGDAKEVNSTSRVRSNRSMALIRPIVPTWTMSSMSPLPAVAETAGGEADQGQVHLDEGVARVLVLAGALLQLPGAGRRTAWTARARPWGRPCRRPRSRAVVRRFRGRSPPARGGPGSRGGGWIPSSSTPLVRRAVEPSSTPVRPGHAGGADIARREGVSRRRGRTGRRVRPGADPVRPRGRSDPVRPRSRSDAPGGNGRGVEEEGVDAVHRAR